jgi:hypothetical protein
MKKAYIILAHKNLDHLVRLLHRLDDGNSTFFIHIDLKTILPDNHQISLQRSNVTLIKRIVTRWGGFSLAEATLNGLEAVRNCGVEFNSISLLSGQDYPIKSNQEIDQYLSASKFSIFLNYFPLPNYQRWSTGGTYRYEKYFMGTTAVDFMLSKSLNFLTTVMPFFARKLPSYLRPYCGSQWWTIDQYALNYILDYIREHPEYSQFHKFTFAPDELFFHIILLNAKDEQIQQRIINDNLRYMKWTTYEHAHPEVLTKKDLPDLSASGSLFARKFDPKHDQEILNLIDEELLCY